LRKKTPRAICLDILNETEKADRHLDVLISDSFKRYRHLTALDRAFLTELAYGTLRWRGKLDWVIRLFSTLSFEAIEVGILNILRLGLYQILFLSRTPASAAVNESAELAKGVRGKGGAGFVNGVLRSVIRKKEGMSYPDPEKDPALHISVLHSHPLWLVQRWIDEMGVEAAVRTCTRNNQIPPLTLRTNTLRIDREALITALREKGLEATTTGYSPEGLSIEEAPPTSELPFLKGGFYVIQDEASQLVTLILEPGPGERILDGCAAPGTKTTHMAQKMMNRGEVIALDLNPERLRAVREGCRRLGVEIVRTFRADATRPFPDSGTSEFDRVLADVPCSGFGTLRRNPDLRWRKDERDVARLAGLQRSILENLSQYVKAGGILVYSTCTVFHEENEDVVDHFLKEHPEFQLDRLTDILPEDYHPFIKGGYFKTFPPVDDMDAFFVARMKKIGKRETGRQSRHLTSPPM
jgi:16S rRNA (cytosine967-C5)-methyltransferase